MPVPHPRRRHVAVGVATATSVGLVLAMASAPPAQAVDTSSPVIINEVFGGGGNSGATLKQDFIELVNTGSTSIDLSGWYLWYASSAGTFASAPTASNRTPLSGTIAPGGVFLVAEALGTGGTQDLPTPDVTGSLGLSGTAGKVALTNSTVTPANSAAPNVVDFVGYGAANDSAGGTPTGGLGSTTSAQRKNGPVVNTGNNGADFIVATPTPKAANAADTNPGGTDCSVTPLPTACTPGPETIQDVQGPGFISPDKGNTVTRVPGVVTGIRSTGSSKGFWMQQPNPSSDASRSSGIYVFTGSAAITVAVGDSVVVTGAVSDYYPFATGDTVDTTSSLSITEITPTTTTVVSSGNPVPAPLVLTPTTVPDTALATPTSGTNIESITTVDPTRSAQEFWEAHEGMLVSVDDARVVGPGKADFGEIYVTTKPEEARNSSGGTTILGYDQVPAGRVLVTPVTGTVPPANVGDVLTGTTAGPVDWSRFGGYAIAATQLGTRQDNDLQPNQAPAQTDGQLAVATYNVENLMPSDSADKYTRLAEGIVNDLSQPDVISVEEVQDNTGATDDGVVAADTTIGKLIAAITAAGGPTYESASIDPVDDQDGGQPGGNIRVVFLYNPERVGFVPKTGTGDPSTTAVTVSTGADGTPTLSSNPGRVDPTNSAWANSRKPLAGEFTFQGQKVIVVGNHFNSKGGDQNSDGRFQPPARSSEVQRGQQAAVLNAFVDQVKAADADANVVLAGDFNDYQFSDAMTTLTDDGALLTDLINTLPPVEQYTYNFNGVSQVLDHIFVSNNLAPTTDYTVVHSNAEFADQASDHDPQVARISFTPTQPATKKITLLNINDFHGRIDSNTVKFAGTVEQQRADTTTNAGPDGTVLLSAGDNIGASLFASSSQGDIPTIQVLNALQLQASAVGNHEFDQGYADLTGRVADAADFDYLGANVYFKGTQNPALPEYKIVTVNGIKVGIIGAVTQETPSLVSPSGIANLDFGNPVQAVNRVAAQLTDGDAANGEADVLVAEYHAGAVDNETDAVGLPQELANGGEFADIVNNTSAAVAAIWTGHTHKTYTFDAPVPGVAGTTRPVVQTGEYGNNIGNITLTVNTSDDSVAGYTMALVPRTTTADDALVAAYPRVAQVKAITDAAIARAAQIGDVPVGSISQTISRGLNENGTPDNRATESALGNVVANMLRDELSTSDLGGAQIGVVNPGGLRADLTYPASGTPNDADGVVTYAEANAVLPFGNRLFTTSLTGAQFKQVLEQQWQPTGAARPYLQLGLSNNVSYTYNPAAAVGSRITSVTVNGNALKPTATYRIGTFSFLSDGGDNFTAFQGGTNVQDTALVDRDLWIDWLGNHQDLTPSFDKRAVQVTDQPSALAAGTQVTFQVSNLNIASTGAPANTALRGYVKGISVGTFPVTNGAATVQFTVPRGISGPATLQLNAVPTGTSVRIPVTVAPSGTVSSKNGPTVAAGDPVTAVLAGWAPGEKVQVKLNGVAKGAPVVVNADGSNKVKFTLPVSTPAGTYALTATATKSGATSPVYTLQVIAKPFQAGSMSVKQSIVQQGGLAKLTLTAWAPRTLATITLDNGTKVLGTVKTDASGNATLSVKVPQGTTVGTHRLVGTAPDGSLVSVNVSVVAAGS
ncbi:5'-nucleotidase C-terminal domain-containing protein [Jatrophihabitans sp. YIM 134969]